MLAKTKSFSGLVDYIETEDRIAFLSKASKNGSLRDYLIHQGRTSISEHAAAKLMRSIATNLVILHECNIAHRDLRMEAFCVKGKKGKTLAKINSFELARFIDPKTFVI